MAYRPRARRTVRRSASYRPRRAPARRRTAAAPRRRSAQVVRIVLEQAQPAIARTPINMMPAPAARKAVL